MLPLANLTRVFSFPASLPILNWADRLPTVGVVIDHQLITCVGLPGRGKHAGGHWHTAFMLPQALPEYTNAHQFQTDFAEILSAITQQYPKTSVRINITLADALFTLRRITVKEPIKTHKALQAFAQWTLAQELGRSVDELSVSYQELPEEDGEQNLIVTAIESQYINWLQVIFNQPGLVLDQVDMPTRYLFNHYHAHFEHNHQTGVLVNIQSQSSSFMIWDEWGQPVHFSSAWHPKQGQAQDSLADVLAEQVTRKLEQVVKSYLAANEDHHVENVYVTGEADLRNICAQAINARIDGDPMMMGTDLTTIWPMGLSVPDAPGIELATVVALAP